MAFHLRLPLSFHSSTFLLAHCRATSEFLAAPSRASVSGTNFPASLVVNPSLQLSPFWNGARGRLVWRRPAAIGSTRRLEGRPLQIEATMEQLEEAARTTVDYFVKSGMTVGLGTGLASSMAINYIGQVQVLLQQLRQEFPLLLSKNNHRCSTRRHSLCSCRTQGSRRPSVNFKGESKAIMKAATQMVFIIEEKQFVGSLEGAVPVLIQQEDWIDVAEEIDDLFLGDAEVWRRPSFGEAGPLGGDDPLVTPEGHYVLDVIFTTPITTAAEVVENLEAIGGVMGHGLVMDTAYAAAIAGPNGVKIRTSLFKTAFTSME